MQNMWLMSRDEKIAHIQNDRLEVINEALLPLYLRRTGNVEGWLCMRAIDEHRTNSRLLKKALRLENKDDISTVLHFNAVTITDSYWIRPKDSPLAYADVRFSENLFDMLALKGDVNSFNQHPSRTPELTNTGSFEKCWRLIDGKWWIYKSENAQERFTELFAYHLAAALGIDTAVYEKDDGYIRSLDFTDGASVNFETAFSVIGEEADYPAIYDKLMVLDAGVANSFVDMCYFDALIFNMDRHEHNFGVLRDVKTGDIISMAPLYDHNIALITRGYPKDISRAHDRLIADFAELIKERNIRFTPPELTERMVEEAIQKTAIPLPQPEGMGVTAEQFVSEYIMNGQRRIQELCRPVDRAKKKHKDMER